jgi:hypothetical protein
MQPYSSMGKIRATTPAGCRVPVFTLPRWRLP